MRQPMTPADLRAELTSEIARQRRLVTRLGRDLEASERDLEETTGAVGRHYAMLERRAAQARLDGARERLGEIEDELAALD